MRHFAPHATLLLPLLLLAAGSSEEHSFEVWKRRHSRVYATPGEEGRRRHVFQANSELIEAHNARRSSVTLAMNALFYNFLGAQMSSRMKDMATGEGISMPDSIDDPANFSSMRSMGNFHESFLGARCQTPGLPSPV